MSFPNPVRTAPTQLVESQSPAAITGKISEISFYQSTAVVSRWVEIPDGKTGPFEIVIGPLPSATHASSVHADQAKGVTVRSMGCRSRPPEKAAMLQGRAGEVAVIILTTSVFREAELAGI
jgi:hypothetical protein